MKINYDYIKKIEFEDIKPYIKNFIITFSIGEIILYIILLFFKSNDNEIILINIFITELHLIYLLIFIILAWSIYGVILVWNSVFSKITKTIIALFGIFLLIVLIIVSCYSLMFSSMMNFHEFRAPNKKHSIVVKEYYQIITQNVIFYKRRNPFFVKSLHASFYVSPGITPPVSGNSYNIKWDNNLFIFEAIGSYGDSESGKVTIDLNKEKNNVDYEVYDSKETKINFNQNTNDIIQETSFNLKPIDPYMCRLTDKENLNSIP